MQGRELGPPGLELKGGHWTAEKYSLACGVHWVGRERAQAQGCLGKPLCLHTQLLEGTRAPQGQDAGLVRHRGFWSLPITLS